MGGKQRTYENATATAEMINAIDPPYLAALTLMLPEGTPIRKQVENGDFQPLNTREILSELRILISKLEVTNTIFRTNHASNYLPLGGIFPQDKQKIISTIDKALSGDIPLRKEYFRGL